MDTATGCSLGARCKAPRKGEQDWGVAAECNQESRDTRWVQLWVIVFRQILLLLGLGDGSFFISHRLLLSNLGLSGPFLCSLRLRGFVLRGSVLGGYVLGSLLVRNIRLSGSIVRIAICGGLLLCGSCLIRLRLNIPILGGSLLRGPLLHGSLLRSSLLRSPLLRGSLLGRIRLCCPLSISFIIGGFLIRRLFLSSPPDTCTVSRLSAFYLRLPGRG